MSLLSSTQGSPERVWSVLRLLDAHGGFLSREELMAWLNPPFRRGDAVNPGQETAASQAILAAISLELVVNDGRGYRLAGNRAPESFLEFADVVHARLCSADPEDPDRVLLEAFAWIVYNIDREGGFSWLSSWRRNQLADAINHDLPARDQADEGRRFNDTKLAPWRAWLSALGLQRDLAAGGDAYPYIAERLHRELVASGLPLEREVEANAVLPVIAQRMPYLDGGALRNELLQRAGAAPGRHLSRVLSVALRDLHEEGCFVMGLRGDSAGMIQLAPDPRHRLKSVAFFTLKRELVEA